MPLAAMLLSLFALVGAYIYVSARDGSYLNVLTPAFVIFIPTNYLLELAFFALFGPSASGYAYVLCYGSYAAFYVALALGYGLDVRRMRLPFGLPTATGGAFVPYAIFAAAFVLYLPVLIEFSWALTNPRWIYEQTRSGYGIFFYLSTMLAYVAYVLFLFRRPVGRKEFLFFTGLTLVFLWLHGSKYHMLVLLFILAFYWVYVLDRRVSLGRFIWLGAGLAVAGALLFLVTTPGVLFDYGPVGLLVYNDYTRNGMMVIDSGIGPYFGTLSWQTEFWSRVPRAMFPGKPDDFGALYLAKIFYPDAFARGTGAPAFGYGVAFADFGAFAPVILFLTGLFSGTLLKMFVGGLRTYRQPGDFIMVLFAAGVPLIPFYGVFLLPESLFLALTANLLHGAGRGSLGRRSPVAAPAG